MGQAEGDMRCLQARRRCTPLLPRAPHRASGNHVSRPLRSKQNPSKPKYLHQLCSQRDIALHAPAPKERNPELVARLAKLQEQLDNKR